MAPWLQHREGGAPVLSLQLGGFHRLHCQPRHPEQADAMALELAGGLAPRQAKRPPRDLHGPVSRLRFQTRPTLLFCDIRCPN